MKSISLVKSIVWSAAITKSTVPSLRHLKRCWVVCTVYALYELDFRQLDTMLCTNTDLYHHSNPCLPYYLRSATQLQICTEWMKCFVFTQNRSTLVCVYIWMFCAFCCCLFRPDWTIVVSELFEKPKRFMKLRTRTHVLQPTCGSQLKFIVFFLLFSFDSQFLRRKFLCFVLTLTTKRGRNTELCARNKKVIFCVYLTKQVVGFS